MRGRARKVCAFPGCPLFVKVGGSLCEQHEQERMQRVEARRPTASQRGYGARWQRESARFLEEHPFCVCGNAHRSEVVDHIKPHRGDQELFWDQSNWQAMAKACHDRKTARTDGGFGNVAKVKAG